MTICTIIAKNYLAAARVLCKSFLKHHPEGKCYVLVTDVYENFIKPDQERFTLVPLREIPLPEPHQSFCFKYNVTELATALKPFFMRWLLNRRGENAIIYLDPDILVTSSLAPLFERLDSGTGLLLTPHLDLDFPDDGLLPDDKHILTSGVFNLGFLGIKNTASSHRFLLWLEGKLSNRCVIDHAAGIFVDQKYFDLAHILFPEFEIIRDPGYNVAYWNLHSRTLECDQQGVWKCNGQLLKFFHFSNYKPEAPDIISSHQTRYNLTSRPDLEPLFAFYRQELLRCGYNETRFWPYSFAFFANGYIVSDGIRRYFRDHLLGQITIMEDPFHSQRLARYGRLLDCRVSLGAAWRHQKQSVSKGLGAIARWILPVDKTNRLTL